MGSIRLRESEKNEFLEPTLIKFFKSTDNQSSFLNLEYLINISMLKGFFDDYKFTGIAQGWSLTVEETFYILAPFFFVLISKNLRYLIILPISIVFFGIILVFLLSNHDLYGFFIDFNFLFGFTFFGRCFEFFVGIFIAICLTEINIPNYKYFTFVGVIGVILSCVMLVVFKGSYEFGAQSPIGRVINSLILPLIGLFFLYIGLIKEKSVLSKILGNKFIVLLGKSSYVFYLIHMGFIYDFIQHFTENNFFTFLFLVLFSVILFKLLEDPIKKALIKTFKFYHFF